MSQDVILARIKEKKWILQSELRKSLRAEGYNTSSLSTEIKALRRRGDVDRVKATEQQSWWLFPL